MEKDRRRIVILEGQKNIGKTTVLNKVINELTNKYGFSAPDEKFRGRDRRVCLTNGEDVRIAICTGGDDPGIIEQNYRFFITEKCDVMVSACTKGVYLRSTKVALIAFASGYFESAEVHFDDDSNHVRQFVLQSRNQQSRVQQDIVRSVLEAIS